MVEETCWSWSRRGAARRSREEEREERAAEWVERRREREAWNESWSWASSWVAWVVRVVWAEVSAAWTDALIAREDCVVV